MIGGRVNASTHELLKWARRMTREHRLKPRDALVLHVLAGYANREGIAWPSIRTLALDCGYKPTPDGRCSAISDSLDDLQTRYQLIWSKQGGHGNTARRELLYRPQAEPSAGTEGSEGQPSASAESSVADADAQPSAHTEAQPSVSEDPSNQRNNQQQQPKAATRESLPRGRKACNPALRKAENQSPVDAERAEVRAHLEAAGFRRPAA